MKMYVCMQPKEKKKNREILPFLTAWLEQEEGHGAIWDAQDKAIVHNPTFMWNARVKQIFNGCWRLGEVKNRTTFVEGFA
jgi:Uma2 family endonuclease